MPTTKKTSKKTSKKVSKKSNVSKKEKKLLPCCACPDTRKLRDECIFEKGEENCTKLIEDHRFCLKEKGFIV